MICKQSSQARPMTYYPVRRLQFASGLESREVPMEAVLTGPMGRTLLGSDEVTIGCDADNSLIIADLRTSAHHALVRPDGLGFAIIDLGSEYGTIVNGRWLEPQKVQPLLPG